MTVRGPDLTSTVTGCGLGSLTGGMLMSYVFFGPRRVASTTSVLCLMLRPPCVVLNSGVKKETLGVGRIGMTMSFLGICGLG